MRTTVKLMLRLKFCGKIIGTCITVGAGLVAIMGYVEPKLNAKTENSVYFCGKGIDGKTPTTLYAHKARGDVEVIRWVSEFGEAVGYDPQKRCDEVSARMQKYHSQGLLNNLTMGRKNSQNIICVAKAYGKPCLDDPDDGQLYTVKPEINPNEALLKLKNYLDGNSGKILEENEQIWIDVNEILEKNPTKLIFK
ncbi:COP23 domain-containing protein [Planktothrix agardhii]|uniref:COP23 domain-containing protein n=1 Tax=Planktothrix agardhii TaxID=1160 RepID=UPI0011D2192D|nr:COP23 domain-containing protein [Planktothrix agardhii]